jgi:hypothetical protein
MSLRLMVMMFRLILRWKSPRIAYRQPRKRITDLCTDPSTRSDLNHTDYVSDLKQGPGALLRCILVYAGDIEMLGSLIARGSSSRRRRRGETDSHSHGLRRRRSKAVLKAYEYMLALSRVWEDLW